MTREEAIRWLALQLSKPIKWDNNLEESKQIREEAERRIKEAFNMAIDALKSQKPRLVTEDDFKDADEYGWLPAWCEEKTGGKVYCECILVGALKENDVRYWTGKPTEEQRRDKKWK